MTPRQSLMVLALTLAAVALMLAFGAARTSEARSSAQSARSTLEQVRSEAERVLELRGRSQTVALGAQPQGDAFQRVNETLTACGLVSTRVESVTPSGDRALSGGDGASARRVQTFRMVLSPILLDELGSFLDRWRKEHRLWTVTGVDLTPSSNRGATDGTFRATLTASAVYVKGQTESEHPGMEPTP